MATHKAQIAYAVVEYVGVHTPGFVDAYVYIYMYRRIIYIYIYIYIHRYYQHVYTPPHMYICLFLCIYTFTEV